MKAMNFKYHIINEKLSEADVRLVQTICSSGQTQLETLSLGGNSEWWGEASLNKLMLDFIFSQQSLVKLNLNRAHLKETE